MYLDHEKQLFLFSYKGYSYSYEKEYEEDNIKIYHTCVDSNGHEESVPFSPYFSPSLTDFQRWIDMGMPTYSDIGDNISRYNIDEVEQKLRETQFIKSVDNLLESSYGSQNETNTD